MFQLSKIHCILILKHVRIYFFEIGDKESIISCEHYTFNWHTCINSAHAFLLCSVESCIGTTLEV